MTVARYPIFLRSVVIDDDNNDLRIEEGGTQYTAIIPAGTYYLRGDGAADDLCLAVKTAMEAASANTNTYSVTVSFSVALGQPCATVTIARATGASTFRPLWASLNFESESLGFTRTNPGAAGTSFTSSFTPDAVWCASLGAFIAKESPREENDATVLRKKNGRTSGILRGGPYHGREILLNLLDGRRATTKCPTSTITDTRAALNTFLQAVSDGSVFEFHRQTTTMLTSTTLSALSSSTLVGDYVVADSLAKEYAPQRNIDGLSVYDVTLPIWEVT